MLNLFNTFVCVEHMRVNIRLTEAYHLYGWLEGLHADKFGKMLENRVTKEEILSYLYLMTGICASDRGPAQLVRLILKDNLLTLFFYIKTTVLARLGLHIKT